jgi:hypothetical protein
MLFTCSFANAISVFVHRIRFTAACGGLVLTGLACGIAHAADATPPKDVYLWTDSSLSPMKINVQAIDGSEAKVLPVDDAKNASLALSGDTLCTLDLDHMLWHSSSITGAADAHVRIPDDAYHIETMDKSMPFPLRADRHGQCLFPFGNSTLGWISAQTQRVATVTVGGDFTWSAMDYVWATDSTVLVGRDQLAVVPNVTKAGRVATVKIHGKVHGLTIDSLTCCSRLSPDGKTLYSMAEAVDAGDTAETVLAAIDVASGLFERFYLPYYPGLAGCGKGLDRKQRADCQDNPKSLLFDHPQVELEGGEPQHIDLSPDGKMLYVRAGLSSDEKIHVVGIDTDSGKITPLPFNANAFAVSASGQYLLVENPDNRDTARLPLPGIKLYKLPKGEFVRDLPGRELVVD